MDQLEKALNACNQSLQLAPNAAFTLDSRGFVYLKKGDLDLRHRRLQRGVEPRSEACQFALWPRPRQEKKGDKAGAMPTSPPRRRSTPNIAETFAGYGIN